MMPNHLDSTRKEMCLGFLLPISAISYERNLTIAIGQIGRSGGMGRAHASRVEGPRSSQINDLQNWNLSQS